jgi:hypothetical protein
MDDRRDTTGGRDDRQTIDERENDLPTYQDGSHPGDAESTALGGRHVSSDASAVNGDRARGEKRGYRDGSAAGMESVPGPYASGIRKSDHGPGGDMRDSNMSGGAEEPKKV